MQIKKKAIAIVTIVVIIIIIIIINIIIQLFEVGNTLGRCTFEPARIAPPPVGGSISPILSGSSW